ncbi:MAG: OmpA family protein, partial [Parvibaculaceae bacterium]
KKKQQAVEPEQQDQAPAVVEEQAPRKEKKKQQALEPEQTPSVEQAETPTKPDRKKTGTEDQQDSSQAAEQGSDDAQSKAAVTAIKDRRNASELEDDELRARFQNVRRAAKSPGLSADQRREFENMAASDRRELLRRKGGGKKQQAAEQERPEDLSKAEVDQRADDLLRQKREAKELDDQALRQRLDETRTVLGSEELSREEQDRLRKRLREDRRVMRERMARRSGEPVDIYVDRRDYSRDDLDRALRDRRRGNDVRERDLNERIRMMRYALNNERYDREQAEMANEYLREDRRVLRERLRRDRDRRRERLSAMRDRDELEIEYDPGYLPPPVIAYAEADDEDIEMQLVAPPRQKLQRRYTVEQIVQDDRVREAMPGIDIDTLTFDTGSAEVRPEEIAKLDKVAETIERIVTARPDEVFMIEGHTDAIGSDASNQILSEARARSIMEALTEFYAIEPDNLRTVGLGERFLKIPTPEAEQENRRVTVRRITPLLARDGG